MPDKMKETRLKGQFMCSASVCSEAEGIVLAESLKSSLGRFQHR